MPALDLLILSEACRGPVLLSTFCARSVWEKLHKCHPWTLTHHLYVSGRAAEAPSWGRRVSCSSLNSAASPNTGPFGDLVSLNKCSSVKQQRLRQLLPLKQTNQPTTPLTAIRPSQLGQTTLQVTSCWKSLCVNAIKICCCFSFRRSVLQSLQLAKWKQVCVGSNFSAGTRYQLTLTKSSVMTKQA